MMSLTNYLRFSTALFFLFITSSLGAQTVAKVFDESYDKVAKVDLTQTRGPLTILPSKDNKIRVVTELSVEAKNKEEGEKFLAKMKMEVQEMSDRLTINIGMGSIRSWTQRNSNTKVVFKDGAKYSGLRGFEISSTLYLPETELLKLETRFERVQIDPKVKINDLNLSLHNAKIHGGSIAGNLELDMRFGEIELDDVGGSVSGTLHNTRVEFGNVGDVRLDARFSKLRMGTLKSLDLDAHNGRLEAKSVSGSVDIEDRFGTYILGSLGNARINTHNGTFEVENGDEYRIEGRFGNFDFGRIDNLIARDNHNCDYDIKELGAVTGNTTFTTFNVERLSQKAGLKMQHGHLRVDEVLPTFTGVDVDGVFFEVKLDFRQPTDYHVRADFRFGNVRLPDDLKVVKREKDHNMIKLEMKTPKATADSPIIRAEGSNGKLYID